MGGRKPQKMPCLRPVANLNVQAKHNKISFCSLLCVILFVSYLGGTTAYARNDAETLFLEVFINNNSTKLIAEFSRDENGDISATIDELQQLGLKIPDQMKGSQSQTPLPLNLIATLDYTYDETNQILNINIGNQHRLAKEYFPREKPLLNELSNPGLGAMLNYSVFASSNEFQLDQSSIDQMSTSLDGWIYSPVGNFFSSAIVSYNGISEVQTLRLDSSWVNSNPETLIESSVGDLISGGLAWTRPIRMGGIQIRKNFDLRPDLITTPLLNATGSAAVPSTVDIYLGNFKAHSQKVDAGRFSINQVPSVAGAGNARIVITDATGREQVTNKPFYLASQLLRPGLFDYSAEIGFARLNYGVKSNDYADQLFGSGTFRYGINDKITLEGHTEFGGDMVNAGLGTSFTLADRALVSLSGAASYKEEKDAAERAGFQFFGSFDTKIGGINIHANSRRSFGDYLDLAAISERLVTTSFNAATTHRIKQKSLDQISIGIPLPKLKAGLNLTFTHLNDVVANAASTISVSYSQKIFDTASLSLSAYSNLDSGVDAGMYVNLSFPVGERIMASTSFNAGADYTEFDTTLSKFADHKPGSVGWSLSHKNGKSPRRHATLNYYGNKSSTQLELHQNESKFRASAYVSGAIVGTTSGIFFSNRIDDAFAIVETGTPDIPVFLANNQVGMTNRFGNLLVPGLASYEENKLHIDPENLPVNASISKTQQIIIPPTNSGIKVPFNVETKTRNAIVIFQNTNGKHLPVGSTVEIMDGGNRETEPFIIGHDGRAYLENLSASNQVVVKTQDGSCHANFNYVPNFDRQIEIGPIVCNK